MILENDIYKRGTRPNGLIYDPVMSKIWKELVRQREAMKFVNMPDGRKLRLTDVEALIYDDRNSIARRVAVVESFYGIRVKDGKNPLDLLETYKEYCRNKKQSIRTWRFSLGRFRFKIEITLPFKKYLQRRCPGLIQ